MAFLLQIEKGKNAGTVLEIPNGEPRVIGRLPGSWLETDESDRWVSAEHAKVCLDAEGQCLLTDNSTNNTFVCSRDGQETRLTKGQTIALNDGDLIRLSSQAVLSVHVDVQTEIVSPLEQPTEPVDRTTVHFIESDPSTLVLKLGNGSQVFVAEGSPFLIGREHDCDLPLSEDRSVSRKHCQIESEGGVFYLKNLSENGTFVQGEIVLGGRIELKDGDQVVLTPGTHFEVALQAERQHSALTPVTEVPGNNRQQAGAAMEISEKITTTTAVLPAGLTRYDGLSGDVPATGVAQRLAACRHIYAIVDFPKAGIPFPPELQAPNYLFNWLPGDVAKVQSPVIITPQETERFYPLIEEAWGKDAVVCFFSSAPAPEMVDHLRRATGYSETDPAPGMLGYFWPRILLTMLNSSAVPQLQTLFSQTDAVLLESDESPSGWSIVTGADSGVADEAGIVVEG